MCRWRTDRGLVVGGGDRRREGFELGDGRGCDGCGELCGEGRLRGGEE